MHVEGLGVFNATANRSPAKVSATFTVRATGASADATSALTIERKPPDVNVQVEANLQDVQLEGHLSRSRIAQHLETRHRAKTRGGRASSVSKNRTDPITTSQ